MISKEEMKTYFLKANYQALRTEFKHDFHETTYFKPTFCNHCDGFVIIHFFNLNSFCLIMIIINFWSLSFGDW